MRRLSWVTYRLIENDNYEISSNGEQRVLEVLARHGEIRTVFDVGANVGDYSMAAARYFPKAAIYAFEPVKRTFDQLTQRLATTPNFKAFNYGLNDRDGVVDFSIRPDDLGNSTSHPAINELLSPGVVRATERCRLRHAGTVATEIGVPSIDLLKVDTEGNDWFVLDGFSDWLSGGRIRTIQFEYGLACISTRRLLLDYYALLQRHGYRVGKIFPTCIEFRDYHPLDEDFIGPNFLAVYEPTGLCKFLE